MSKQVETNMEGMTRQQLKELETKEMTPFQRFLEVIIVILPFVCGILAIQEYRLVPNNSTNRNPNTYLVFLILLVAAYVIYGLVAAIKRVRGDKGVYEKLRFKAPLFSALFLLLAGYDYLTLKTGILTQPFVPCLNFVLNAAWNDREMLIECTIHTLWLLFLGYTSGVVLGLITGITCGYSKRCRYWVDPIIKFLGPIPTSTWIPIMMVVAKSLFGGAVFIIALGSWFAVTVASMNGIANVDKDYFEAARTLGATERQLVFRVAIPHAMPSILSGCTQAMSSSCVAIMIAEMLGVKSGLGWYMNWAKSWASYDKMFAALFVICIIFTVVTKSLDAVKRHVLRWQNGAEK
ncbi:MAG: ABC transporter permease [Oscillospiraceae bacterium]|nr:ABC transporter permease [Oscillospiraceae bacterium]